MEKNITKPFDNQNLVTENNFDSIKITLASPEVHYSSDEMLIMSVVHEWDGGKMVIMAFVTFKDGKAIEMISAKGDPA